MLELNRPSPTIKAVPTSQAPSENQNDTISRPEGRDSAKKLRTSGGDSTSSSTAVEVLQKIHERNGKTEEKQEEQMQAILSMKGDKMKLSEKLFELQKEDMEKRKEDMEKRSKLKEEQLILKKQDIEVRAKQSEAQLLTAELGIMGVDLEKLAPPVKAYYIAMQQKILERRGISVPPRTEE